MEMRAHTGKERVSERGIGGGGWDFGNGQKVSDGKARKPNALISL